MSVNTNSCAAIDRRQVLKPFDALRRLREPTPPIECLLVDLCGVLYDDTAWRRWLLRLVNRVGLHTHYTPFFRVWEREYLDHVKRGELKYWQAFRMFLHSAGLSHGQIDEVEAAGHARRRAFEEEIIPLPGVTNTLTRLTDLGIKLTLLSTALLTTIEVRQRLVRLGLESNFDTVLSAPEMRRNHPDKNVFSVAIEWASVGPQQLGFVARDSAALLAARAAGLRTVAVNYDDDAQANAHIDQFNQLLDALPWKPARMVG